MTGATWVSHIPAEAWAILASVVTALTTGVGFLVKFFADRTIAKQAQVAKQATDTADALALAQTKLIESAERREQEANERADRREETSNKRMEAAIAGMTSQSQVITDLTTTVRSLAEQQKALLEEVRRGNGNNETLSRQVERLLGSLGK